MPSRSDTDFLKKKEKGSELTSKGSAEDTLLLHDIHKASATEREATGEIIHYQPDETLAIQVKLDAAHDTVWLNRQQMAELFGRDVKTIGKHVNNALKEELASEQQINPSVAFFATVQFEGQRKVERQVEYWDSGTGPSEPVHKKELQKNILQLL